MRRDRRSRRDRGLEAARAKAGGAAVRGWRTYVPPSASWAIRPTATTRRPRASSQANGSPAAISARVGRRFEASSPGWVGTTFQSSTSLPEAELGERPLHDRRRRLGRPAPVSCRSEVNGIPDTRVPRYPGPRRRAARCAGPRLEIGASRRRSSAAPLAVTVEVDRSPPIRAAASRSMNDASRSHTLTDGGQRPPRDRARSRRRSSTGAKALARPRPVRLRPRSRRPPRSSATRSRARPRRGVAVRLAYNVDHAQPDPGAAAAGARRRADRVAPARGAADRRRARPDAPQVRRSATARRCGPARRTGPTTRGRAQENVIAVVDSAAIAHDYGLDFEQLLADGRRRAERASSTRAGTTACAPGSRRATARISRTRIAQADRAGRAGACGSARRCSRPRPVLGALRRSSPTGRVDVAGCVDATQIRDVVLAVARERQRRLEDPAARSACMAGPFSGKPSTPYGAGTVHDFMHAKVTVADDTVLRRLLQPLALGRAERRERARDRRCRIADRLRPSPRSARTTTRRPGDPGAAGASRGFDRRRSSLPRRLERPVRRPRSRMTPSRLATALRRRARQRDLVGVERAVLPRPDRERPRRRACSGPCRRRSGSRSRRSRARSPGPSA